MIEINGYAKAIGILRNIFEGDPTVHSIGHGMLGDEDLKKMTVYPLVFISPEPTGENANSNLFRFFVVALAQRMDNTEGNEKDYFETNDNFTDNLNSTFAILNRMAQKLRTDYDDYVSDDWTFSATPVVEQAGDILDGWSCFVDIELKSSIC